MCIIVALPENTTLTNEEWTNCALHNPDGAGYAFVNGNNKIVVRKTGDNFNVGELRKQFEADYAKFKGTTPFLLHFRISTHGEVCQDNCHPFEVNDKTVFAHNGILRKWAPTKEDPRSDTRIFAEKVLKPLPQGWLNNEGLRTALELVIGSSNKLVFLTSRRKLHIINEDRGEWDKGRWFSNNSYKDVKPVTTKVSTIPATKAVVPVTQQQKVSQIQIVCESCLTPTPKTLYSYAYKACYSCLSYVKDDLNESGREELGKMLTLAS